MFINIKFIRRIDFTHYFADWGPLVEVVGYCFLNLGSKYQPQDKFVQWIQNGPEPIYILGLGAWYGDLSKLLVNLFIFFFFLLDIVRVSLTWI